MALGATVRLAAEVRDQHGRVMQGAVITWSSSDASVATVDTAGLVTAVSAGSTQITAAAGEARAVAAVIVELRASSIAVEPRELGFAALGDTARLTAVAMDANGHPIDGARVTWTSADTAVATVDEAGLVTAAGNGGTTIKATSGSASAEVGVAVEQVAARLTVSPSRLFFEAAGDTASLEAAVTDANGHEMAGAAVTWSTADSSVATVDGTGLVTVTGVGAADVTAARDSVADSAEVEVAAPPSSDREVLELLYRVWNGDDWNDRTNWLTDAPLSDWAGVDTDGSGRVNFLSLRNQGLEGRIPAYIGLLEELFILDLSVNSLRGPVPPEIGQLLNLRDLFLGSNDLSGPLPPELGDLLGLRYLSVSSTDLSGPLPDTFARLAIERFYFSDTGLCVPPSLDAWFAGLQEASDPLRCIPATPDRDVLVALYRATGGSGWERSDRWASDHPINIWNGVKTNEEGYVTELDLPYNNLTGSLPPELGNLGQLEVLSLYENDLTGRIPPELGKLTNLRDLRLSGNRLEGSIPPELGNLLELRFLDVSSTDLSGPLPDTFAQLAIERFYFSDTGLCVPPSLDAWFAGLQETSDALRCLPTTPDRDVLVALYQATGGSGWERSDRWASDQPINTWEGVKANEEGYVTELDLRYNNLTGRVPPSLGDLAHIERLQLFGNELTGEIPPELGKLTNLSYLSLSTNKLAGSIPPELGNLVNVDTLYLSRNELSGPIPPELGNMRSLQRLALFNNRLSGPFPREFGNLKKLKDLWLTNNEIEGPLPPEIGDMVSLEEISLGRNQVSGRLPTELGKLGALKSIRLDDNRIEGPIPPSLANLAALEMLAISANRLTGSIPPELGRLSHLEFLSLFNNRLTGAIPPELGKLPKLGVLWLGDNELSGAIPPELGNLSVLEQLHLAPNRLSGPIPPELAALRSLEFLGLFHNNLSGPLPPELGDLNNLEVLQLASNSGLEGLLPRSLINMESLSVLHAPGTGLCAQIDDEFQRWLGTFDATLEDCGIGRVERLALAEFFAASGGDSWTRRDGWNTNASVGDWHGLTSRGGRVRSVTLPDNGLTGPMPPEIANLTALETLDLGGNELDGAFPVAIASMADLASVRFSGNREMAGPLPFRLTELTRLEALRYEDTGLCASPAMTFQAWLGRIDVVAGAVCENPAEVGLSLPVVYLTQAIQRPAGDVPLIAGRDALLRVFLASDEPGAFFELEVAATFTLGGREVHRVVMRRDGDLLATVPDESDLRNSYNAVIPGEYVRPGLEFVVEADPGGTVPLAAGSQVRFPDSGAAAPNVIEVPPMELTVVPVLEAAEPDSSIFEWTDNIADDSPEVGLFRYSFPFGEFTARSREPYFTSLDLTSDDGQWRLVLEMEALRAVDNGTGYYYAAAASVNGYVRGRARLAAWASMGKAWDTELAHEVGHNLDLRHAPCGGALGTDPDFPYPNGGIGAWGYDFRDGSIVSAERRRDIMGYCYERGWLSDYYFEKVIEYRERVEADRARALIAARRPNSEVLVLWGGVVNGQLRLEPSFRLDAAPLLPEGTGPYRVEGIGRDGNVEFSLAFTPGEDKFGDKYFFFTIPIEAGWDDALDRITLTGPEGVVTVASDDNRALSVVTDPDTGRIRAILRDWDGPLPAAVGRAADVDVATFRTLSDAIRPPR